MGDVKLPGDPKKKAGTFLGLIMLGGIGMVVAYYLIPFLLTVTWGLAELGIATVAAALVLYVVTSKTFWRRSKIILDALGNIFFGWFIEMNPFVILRMQLDEWAEDRQELFKQKGKLEAQDVSLTEKLESAKESLRLAAKKIQICQERRISNPEDEDNHYQLEKATNDYANAEDFIKKVSPIKNDIGRLVAFAEKAYRKSGYALENAKATLESQKSAYDAVTAGSNAMTRALRAFNGRPDMNKSGEIALSKLKMEIATKIGTIKNCIAETSKVMSERDLNDAAKVSLAADNIAKLNVDATFDISSVVTGPLHIPDTVKSGNKWLNTLK